MKKYLGNYKKRRNKASADKMTPQITMADLEERRSAQYR
jgi:hypothetical protein